MKAKSEPTDLDIFNKMCLCNFGINLIVSESTDLVRYLVLFFCKKKKNTTKLIVSNYRKNWEHIAAAYNFPMPDIVSYQQFGDNPPYNYIFFDWFDFARMLTCQKSTVFVIYTDTTFLNFKWWNQAIFVNENMICLEDAMKCESCQRVMPFLICNNCNKTKCIQCVAFDYVFKRKSCSCNLDPKKLTRFALNSKKFIVSDEKLDIQCINNDKLPCGSFYWEPVLTDKLFFNYYWLNPQNIFKKYEFF